jgi:hypothetical protein
MPGAPTMPSGGNYWGQIGADHSAECMDLCVIREEPLRQQPSYCH